MSSAETSQSSGSYYRTLSKVLVSLLSVGLVILFGIFGMAMLKEMFSMPHVEKAPVAAAAPAVAAAPTAAPTPGAGSAAPAAATPPAPASPLAALGAQMYANCVACHGTDGKGAPIPITPPMAPSLAGSAFVNGSTERLAMILLNGIQPEGRFTGIMVSMKPIMDDEKMAAVLTHVRSNFGNSAPPITPEQVKAAREKYASRPTPFTRAELDANTANLP